MPAAIFHVDLEDDLKNFRLVQNGLSEFFWQRQFEGTWIDLRTEGGGGRGLAVKKFDSVEHATTWMEGRKAEHTEYKKQLDAKYKLKVIQEGA